jgi:hypothetical protein
MNAGVREALKENDFHCFVFHDVDLIPEGNQMSLCGLLININLILFSHILKTIATYIRVHSRRGICLSQWISSIIRKYIMFGISSFYCTFSMANWKTDGVLFLYRFFFFFDLILLSLVEKEKIKQKRTSLISNIFGTALIMRSINSSLGAF